MSKTVVELRDVTKIFPAGRGSEAVTAVSTLNLEIQEGEFFTMLGPSGCGKTTTLRMIAGFEQPTSGEIFIEGRPMSKVAPNRRPVNTVFQNYALFPHLDVQQNVAFGMKVKRVPSPERQRRVTEALALVRLPGMEKRKPSQLSGGQQQRVALARALVNEPAVLLLDEPLGALDLKLRKEVQLELKQLQDHLGITFIYVTHDQEEAMTMSNRIAVMNEGVVQQVGSPREIYETPANRFVADFIGETNFLNGTVVELGDFVNVDIGGLRVLGAGNGQTLEKQQPVTVAIRPEKINLYPHGTIDVLETEIGLSASDLAQIFGGNVPDTAVSAYDYLSAEEDNVVLDGRIEEAIYIGTDLRYRVVVGQGIRMTVRIQNFGVRYDTTFNPGDRVYVHWAAEHARVLTE
jgi:spermidine/putrescine transport system ATP-binding protein